MTPAPGVEYIIASSPNLADRRTLDNYFGGN
jgi:hypothetical protein